MGLRFELHLLPRRAATAPDADLHAWAELTIALEGDSAREILLRCIWRMDELIDWYIAHHATIRHAIFPYALDGESLAAASNRLNGVTFRDPAEAEQWDEMLYQFRVSRCLIFALRGALVPWVFIGLNGEVGEISLDLEPDSIWHQVPADYPGMVRPGSWAFRFDMADFHRAFKAEIERFLADWAARPLSEAGRERVAALRRTVEKL